MQTPDKGWGLSFFCELLGASLIGASTIASKDVPKTTKRVNSMMAIVIDPSLAQTDGPGAGLAAEIDELVAYAKESGELTCCLLPAAEKFLFELVRYTRRACGPDSERTGATIRSRTLIVGAVA